MKLTHGLRVAGRPGCGNGLGGAGTPSCSDEAERIFTEKTSRMGLRGTHSVSPLHSDACSFFCSRVNVTLGTWAAFFI